MFGLSYGKAGRAGAVNEIVLRRLKVSLPPVGNFSRTEAYCLSLGDVCSFMLWYMQTDL
jgi:hypothetical protein